MVRPADNRQDSDRPHYYSQYWINVAMGKTTSPTTTVPAEDEVEDEDELDFAAPVAEVKPDTRAKSPKAAEKKPDTGHSTLTSLADLANIEALMRDSAAMDDSMTPDITTGLGAQEMSGANAYGYEAPETEAASGAADEEFAFEDDDEEEEDDDWGGSRRKKPAKNKRREPHRDY